MNLNTVKYSVQSSHVNKKSKEITKEINHFKTSRLSKPSREMQHCFSCFRYLSLYIYYFTTQIFISTFFIALIIWDKYIWFYIPRNLFGAASFWKRNKNIFNIHMFSITLFNHRFFKLIKSSKENTNNLEKKQNSCEITNWELSRVNQALHNVGIGFWKNSMKMSFRIFIEASYHFVVFASFNLLYSIARPGSFIIFSCLPNVQRTTIA